MSIAVTFIDSPSYQEQPVIPFKIDWVSDGSGNATGVMSDANGNAVNFNGTLLQVAFKPSDAAAPSSAYDVTITNDAGVDVLGGNGANLSATVGSQETGVTTGGFPFVLGGPLTLNVSNAGAAKAGSIYLFIR